MVADAWIDIWVLNFKNRGFFHPNHPIFDRVFPYKPSILGCFTIFGNTHMFFPNKKIGHDFVH